MRIRTPAMFTKKCRHETTIVVRSTGMERTVCEDCGHISFAFSQVAGVSITEEIQEPTDEEHKKAS